MTVINLYLSIITLNIIVLNSLIKRHRVVGWIKKNRPTICCLQETHFCSKDTHTQSKGIEKKGNQRKPGVAILT